ncbi:hypothetical protein CASFOL_030145 [Castilleja foliolosa]|uniref:FBD domain-containing protein n=1 Tax=Castilleja foliolosa TaxID=1961234 RepID=A0ABD3CB84_9LAMI
MSAAVGPEKNYIVRYLLENAKVLEKMEIYLGSHSFPDDRTKLFEFLSSVRGSEACELVISYNLSLYSKMLFLVAKPRRI